MNRVSDGTSVKAVHSKQQGESISVEVTHLVIIPAGNVNVTPNITPLLMPEIVPEPDNRQTLADMQSSEQGGA